MTAYQTPAEVYKAIRSQMIERNGVVGTSKATGSPLPRMTQTDLRVTLAVVAPICVVQLNLWCYPNGGIPEMVVRDQIKTDADQLDPNWGDNPNKNDPGHIDEGRSLVYKGAMIPFFPWLFMPRGILPTARVTGGVQYFARFDNGFPKSLAGHVVIDWGPGGMLNHITVAQLMESWDAVVRLAGGSYAGKYLSLTQTESFWSAVYKVIDKCAGAVKAMTKLREALDGKEIQHVADIVGNGPQQAADAIKEGAHVVAEVAGQVAGEAANIAGRSLGTGIDSFLSQVGVWGLVFIAAVYVGHKYL